jgi:hypothetical protein
LEIDMLSLMGMEVNNDIDEDEGDEVWKDQDAQEGGELGFSKN